MEMELLFKSAKVRKTKRKNEVAHKIHFPPKKMSIKVNEYKYFDEQSVN